jgi:hypothetical protein
MKRIKLIIEESAGIFRMLMLAVCMFAVSCGDDDKNSDPIDDGTEQNGDGNGNGNGDNGDNGKPTAITADNWQKALKDTYGVELSAPAGWSFKEGEAGAGGNSHGISFTTAAADFDAASEAFAAHIFAVTAAASKDGNYASPDAKDEPLDDVPVIGGVRSQSSLRRSDAAAASMPADVGWYFTGSSGVAALRIDFASGGAIISIVNTDPENVTGKGILTIQNLPAVKGEVVVRVHRYSGELTSEHDLYGFSTSDVIAMNDGIKASSAELYTMPGYSRVFSESGTYAVFVSAASDGQGDNFLTAGQGMYFGQVKFTNGNATVNYRTPTYDPSPCAPYHTGGKFIRISSDGQYEGWPHDAFIGAPSIKTPYGYEFEYDRSSYDGSVSTIYISIVAYECDDFSVYDGLIEAIYAQYSGSHNVKYIFYPLTLCVW